MSNRTNKRERVAPDLAQYLPNVNVARTPHRNRRKERRHPPAGENARDRFLRIGSQRMKNVLRDLRLIGNLSAAHYDVAPRDVHVMQRAITGAIDQTFSRFAQSKGPKKIEDTFSMS